MGTGFAVGTCSAGGGFDRRILLGGSYSKQESHSVLHNRSGVRKRWGTRWEYGETAGSSSGEESFSVPGLVQEAGIGLSGCWV